MVTTRNSTVRKRTKTPVNHFFSEKSLKTTKSNNNTILQYYYDSCARHQVSPNPNAAIAFTTSSPFLFCRSRCCHSNTDLNHLLPICETLAAFKHTASITHLSFQQCQLGPMCVPAMVAMLKVNETITTLDLPGNLITDEVAEAVGEMIVTAVALERLNIDANGMTKKAAETLAASVLENGGHTTKLQHVVLTNNYLTQAGVNALSKASHTTGIEIALETGNFWVEETWNAITHGCGSVWSIVALVLLCQHASYCNASTRTWWAIMVYSISQLTMFLCSTLYHSFSCCVAPSTIYIFGVLDHTAIYLLIAGTYTPYLIASPLYEQHHSIAWASMASVWALAFFGISLDAKYGGENKIVARIGLVIYLVQGWFVLCISSWLFPLISGYSLNMLGLGGLAYTGGVYFYIKGETEVRYHVLWHMFVFLGAVLHYFSVKDLLFGEKGIHQTCGLGSINELQLAEQQVPRL